MEMSLDNSNDWKCSKLQLPNSTSQRLGQFVIRQSPSSRPLQRLAVKHALLIFTLSKTGKWSSINTEISLNLQEMISIDNNEGRSNL